jgi:hypothetical protein
MASHTSKIAHQSEKEIDMARTRFIVFTALALIASGVCTSCTAEKDIVRAQDRVEIEQLM